MDAERRAADQAERALGADHQPGEVVARRGLARPRVGSDDPPAGVDHRHRQDVLTHRAVADRRRARGAGGDHPAERRIGAGVDREEDALGAQLGVQLAARDPGLHLHVEILQRQVRDPVHLPHVDGDPAGERGDVALQRGAGAERDDRQPVGGGHADDLGALVDRTRPDDRVGARLRMKRLVVGVLRKDVGAGQQAIGAERVAQRPERLLDACLWQSVYVRYRHRLRA